MESDSGTHWLTYGVAVTMVIFFTYKDADISVKPLLYWLFLVSAIFFAAEYAIWASRYNDMPKVIGNGFSGSIRGRPVPVGNYFIFNTGESLFPVPLRGKLATLVVNKDTLEKYGENYSSTAFCQKKPVGVMPRLVYLYLKRNKDLYNLKNIFFGEFTESQMRIKYAVGDKEADVKTLDHELEDNRYIINYMKDLLAGKTDSIMDEVVKSRELSGQTTMIEKMKKTIEDMTKQRENNL